MTPARKIATLDHPFPMRRGGAVNVVQIAFETWGRLNSARDNAVLIFTGLSPSAHAASSSEDPAPGWWEEMIGPRHPLDTDRFFVICMNSLGSCFGSTGPASLDPETGKPYRLSFPVLSIEDIAHAGHELTRALGIDQLAAVLGPSMGGMTALAYGVLYPDAARGLVVISGSARALPFSIALRSLQREIIRSDPAWHGGDYVEGEGPIPGMRLARKLGMISYRSAREWDQRFGRMRIGEEHQTGDPFCIDFEVEAYLQHHAEKFTGQFDANCYLYLSRSMDLFDVAEYGGTVDAALAKVRAEHTLIAGVETDLLFPLRQQEELAQGLERAGRNVTFCALPSLQGHDSFLVDMDRFRPMIGEFFARL